MKKIILAMIICFGIFIGGEKNSEASELYDVIYQNILYSNGDETESQQITEAIFYAAAKCEVDPILITSVMEAESNFHFDSYSNAGAIGLMQIMPETAQSVGINPYDFFDTVSSSSTHVLRTECERSLRKSVHCCVNKAFQVYCGRVSGNHNRTKGVY